MEFKVVNAGNCIVCGKPIILPPRENNKQLKNKIEKIGLPDIFFCEMCATRVYVCGRESEGKNE